MLSVGLNSDANTRMLRPVPPCMATLPLLAERQRSAAPQVYKRILAGTYTFPASVDPCAQARSVCYPAALPSMREPTLCLVNRKAMA